MCRDRKCATKRILWSLFAGLLLVGLMPSRIGAAPKPQVATASGKVAFVDVNAEPGVTVRADFAAAELLDSSGYALPNGYMTISVGTDPAETLAPVYVYPYMSDGVEHITLRWVSYTELVDLTLWTADGHQLALLTRAWLEPYAYVNYLGAISKGSYTWTLSKVKDQPPHTATTALALSVVGTSMSAAAPDVTASVTGRPFNGGMMHLTASGVTPGVEFATTYEFVLRDGDSVFAQGTAVATADATCGGYRIVDAATITGGTGRRMGATGSFTLTGCFSNPTGQVYELVAQLTGELTS